MLSHFSATVNVALFRAPLDLEADRLETLAATLSRQETVRADAIQSVQARARFIADHGWRRRLLAEHGLGAAAELAFTVGEHGKPRLAGIHFSASRSEDVAWYAVSEQAEVGIDLEWIDRDRALEPLARRLLTPRERVLYDAIGATERAPALYACWTCKEAAVKALGSGLVFPLTTLEAWANDGSAVRAGGLEIRSLPGAPGRAGAVAVRVQASDTVEIQPMADLSWS
jgi:4'-phosphopantetheinyl transferase